MVVDAMTAKHVKRDKDIGGRIRQARVHADMTADDLAGRANISVSALRRYETGCRSVPASVLAEIASVFDKSIASFVPGDPCMEADVDDIEVAEQLINKEDGRRLIFAASHLEDAALKSISEFASNIARGGAAH